MVYALVCAALSLLPLAARRREWARPRVLASPLVVYGVLVVLGYVLARYTPLRIPPFSPFSKVRGAMAILGLTFHGYGVLFPAFYLVVALRLKTRAVGAAALAVLALCGWGLLIEPAQLEVRTEALRSPRAPARPLRILHVSDIQTDGPCQRERLAAIAAGESAPDLVIITGDLANDLYLEDRSRKIQAVNTLLRSVRARHGGFLVRGDWDGWDEDWPAIEKEMLEGTNVRTLSNEAVRLTIDGADVVIYGVEGGHQGDPVLADLTSDPALRIVAMHHPDLAHRVAPNGADLIMAGHTHGGQVVLPLLGALITHSEHGYVGGRYDVGGIPMVISRGIGMRGGPAPRVRFACPPEIGIITVSR